MFRNIFGAAAALALSAGIWMAVDRPVLAYDDDKAKINIVDNCDPKDPGWAPTGGCLIKKGDVSVAEFGAFLFSSLGGGRPGGILIGHPSWRMQPSYASLEQGKTIHVTNVGGRVHTFTEVPEFGGGRVAGLNGGLAQVGACLAPSVVNLSTGDTVDLKALTPGLHRFQCCIHPWMRAAVRIGANGEVEREVEKEKD